MRGALLSIVLMVMVGTPACGGERGEAGSITPEPSNARSEGPSSVVTETEGETTPVAPPTETDTATGAAANEPTTAPGISSTSGSHEEVPAEPLAVRRLGGRCGDNALEGGGGPDPGAEDVAPPPPRETTVVAAGSARGRVRVTLEDYVYYCDPAPRFRAERRGDTITLVLLPIEPGTPVARCTCFHEVRLRVDDVPAGRYRVIVEGMEVRPVLRDGTWVEARETFDAEVEVR